MQKDLLELQSKYPKKNFIVADKGTMGVGSSRMSGVNNVALWIGKKRVSIFHLLTLLLWLEEQQHISYFHDNC